jgi:hypothetical protein
MASPAARRAGLFLALRAAGAGRADVGGAGDCGHLVSFPETIIFGNCDFSNLKYQNHNIGL